MSASLPAVILWLPVAIAVFWAMDVWAALLHGRLWHGWLWHLHASHHRARPGAFEANDALSALHAPIAIALLLYGCWGPAGALREIAFGSGLGMTAFGLAYLVVHDGLVHGRLPVRWLRRSAFLRRIANAHRVHHAGTAGGRPYGLFSGPAELARHGASRDGEPASVMTGRRPRPGTARARAPGGTARPSART